MGTKILQATQHSQKRKKVKHSKYFLFFFFFLFAVDTWKLRFKFYAQYNYRPLEWGYLLVVVVVVFSLKFWFQVVILILLTLFGIPCKQIHFPTYSNPYWFFLTDFCSSVEGSWGLPIETYSSQDSELEGLSWCPAVLVTKIPVTSVVCSAIVEIQLCLFLTVLL